MELAAAAKIYACYEKQCEQNNRRSIIWAMCERKTAIVSNTMTIVSKHYIICYHATLTVYYEWRIIFLADRLAVKWESFLQR